MEALYTPLAQWWRAVCTAATATTSALEVVTTAPANLCESRYLDRWVSRAKDDLNVRLGHGGPALTSAAFTAGIADVRKLLGRWKSDAMLRYLHVPAMNAKSRFAQSMLDNGLYTFEPATVNPNEPDVLPLQAPPTVRRLANPQSRP